MSMFIFSLQMIDSLPVTKYRIAIKTKLYASRIGISFTVKQANFTKTLKLHSPNDIFSTQENLLDEE